jgi:hypothetical protein
LHNSKIVNKTAFFIFAWCFLALLPTRVDGFSLILATDKAITSVGFLYFSNNGELGGQNISGGKVVVGYYKKKYGRAKVVLFVKKPSTNNRSVTLTITSRTAAKPAVRRQSKKTYRSKIY